MRVFQALDGDDFVFEFLASQRSQSSVSLYILLFVILSKILLLFGHIARLGSCDVSWLLSFQEVLLPLGRYSCMLPLAPWVMRPWQWNMQQAWEVKMWIAVALGSAVPSPSGSNTESPDLHGQRLIKNATNSVVYEAERVWPVGQGRNHGAHLKKIKQKQLMWKIDWG